MKRSVVLGRNQVLCPCCGHMVVIDATVRLKGEPLQQTPLYDDDDASTIAQLKEEAERHG